MDLNGTAGGSRRAEAVERRGLPSPSPVLAAVGGCAFAAFWITAVFQISVPWVVSLPIHAFAMVTLAVGVLALQKAQAGGGAERAWTWIPAVGEATSVFVSFEVFSISTILFGWVALELGRPSKLGAILLIAGRRCSSWPSSRTGPSGAKRTPNPPLPSPPCSRPASRSWRQAGWGWQLVVAHLGPTPSSEQSAGDTGLRVPGDGS